MILGALLMLVFWSWCASCYMIDGDPSRRAEFLDSQEKYHLEWTVDRQSSRITFNLTVKTQGWIYFGLANTANEVTGKDVVIGGVLGQNGTAYFSDRHEEWNGVAIVDKRQDYRLEQSWETKMETFLSFSRSLDTCDPHDYKITQNKISIIWAFGETDFFDGIEGKNYRVTRGSYDLYLLDLEYSPRIIRDSAGNPRLDGSTIVQNEAKNLQLWSIFEKVKIPSTHTSYLCSIHKGPRLLQKHHIVGFDYYFPDKQSVEHSHHIIVQRCVAPRGYNAKSLFEPFVNAPAESCYFFGKPPKNPTEMPIQFCTELYLGWGIGGRVMFFPPELGIPLGEEIEEYYLVQVHYDNPELKKDVDVTVRIDYWYTSQLRPNDAGVMAVGVETLAFPAAIFIPPQTRNHRVWGHCSGECTKRMLPPEGINIFAAVLHSHNSGTAMRLRHYDMSRNVELPWISYDDNYSNKIQLVRPLEKRVLPGDQLTMECTYDNTWTNGSVISGYSTKHEMCSAFLLYYGRIRDYSQCRADIVDDDGKRQFLGGLGNISWVEGEIDWVATSPSRLSGLTVTEISDQQEWSERQREELRRYQRRTPMVSRISKSLSARSDESFKQALLVRSQLPLVNPPVHVDTEDDFAELVGYPFEAKPYIVPSKNDC